MQKYGCMVTFRKYTESDFPISKSVSAIYYATISIRVLCLPVRSSRYIKPYVRTMLSTLVGCPIQNKIELILHLCVLYSLFLGLKS